jgi:glycosyltransferase involved in cell wall biosynthesis
MTRDEEDIIGLCLTHAARFCTEIFVLDNGSTDRTWQIVNELSVRNQKIIPLERKICPYGIGLKGYIFNKVRDRFKDGDWILVLDSDEFLEEDPSPYIANCENRGFDMINAIQAQFYITPLDLNKDWFIKGKSPIESFQDLPGYYLINWKELRLFRYNPTLQWQDMDKQGNPTQLNRPSGLKRKDPKGIINRHYQYRSLPQMERRLKLRANIFKVNGRFPHNRDPEIFKYIRNQKKLNHSVEGKKIRPTYLDLLTLYFVKKSKRFKNMLQNRTMVNEMRLKTFEEWRHE